jgi:pyridoxamine 5'-phosphate oxidase
MFATWFAEARASVKPLPQAMALATAGPGGRPSVRMVLLKGFDAAGFVFYTNYRSRKAAELAQNARASLLFWWGSLERQVRIEGRVTKVTRRESDEYFATRPRGSQLGAWASPQSEKIADRAALDWRYAAAAARYAAAVPRPPYWGGYRLNPATIEFWQGRDAGGWRHDGVGSCE